MPQETRFSAGEHLNRPLSAAQLELWFQQKAGSGEAIYNIGQYIEIHGDVAPSLFLKSMRQVLQEAEALCVRFVEERNEPRQILLADPNCLILLIDISAERDPQHTAEKWMKEDMAQPVDLVRGPISASVLFQLGAERFFWYQRYHALVNDDFGSALIARRVAGIYTALMEGRLPERTILGPLQHLLDEESAYRVSGQAASDRDYWLKCLHNPSDLVGLSGIREIMLPQATVLRKTASLNSRSMDTVVRLAKDAEAPCSHVMIAAVGAYICRMTGVDEVLLGIKVPARSSRTSHVPGRAENVMPLRITPDFSMSFPGFLRQVSSNLREALLHQHYRHEDLRQDLGLHPQSRLFSATVQVIPRDADLSFGGHSCRIHHISQGAVADLAVLICGEDNFRELHVEFDANPLSYHADELNGHHQRFLGFLERLQNFEQPIGKISLLSEDERCRILYEWNATEAKYPRDKCVHELFEEQVTKSPHAVAVIFHRESLSYRELNRRANHLANCLCETGVQPGEKVAALLERSIELVIAELAILKCGAVYVPIDPTFPRERIAFMLADSEIKVACSGKAVNVGEIPGVKKIDVTRLPPEGATNPIHRRVTSQSTAYVMYTSGSTGEPKGVLVPHYAISRLVLNSGYVGFSASARVAFAANPAFDASTMEVWAPLLNGGRIIIISEDVLLDPARFRKALKEHNVNVLWLSVGLFNQYAETLSEAFGRLNYFVIGGDVLDPRIVRRLLLLHPPQHLINGYGPTETTTFATTYEIVTVPENARSIPIGKPIANTRVYILDTEGEPVPAGVAGELYIGGDGIAWGYLNRADLTGERFVPDGLSGDAGARLYRTGDLGRWLKDGTIEFLGRNDSQVKVRGFRVEPGEIEARLRKLPELEEALVVVQEDTSGEKQLVAYYTTAEKSGRQRRDLLRPQQLRSFLAAVLPDYMVPRAYVWLERLPLTANGKVDRKALPGPEADAYGVQGYEAPCGEVEVKLAGIWGEVLKVKRVGRQDNFFEMGGHSLLAVRVMSRIRQSMDVIVTVGDMLTHPRLRDFAQRVKGAERGKLPPIGRMERGERIPLSFAQQRLWFLAQMKGASRAYHVPLGIRLKGELDEEALRRALNRIVERHEVLRTRFIAVEGEAEQRIVGAEESGFELLEQDVREMQEREKEIRRLVEEESGGEFDLEEGPLIRGRLIHVGEQEHVLLITMHHIVSDGWSVGVLVEELSALYGAYVRGGEESLEELEVQYADYAVWQRRWVEGEVLREQGEYWRKTLSGAPGLLEVPGDHARPARQSYAGRVVELEWDEKLTKGLRELSRKQNTTLYMTLLAGWVVLLSRLSGQEDIVVGTPVANRGRVEIEKLIGFFVNTVAVRVESGGGVSVAELLKRVKNEALAALQHQDIPFEQVVELVKPVRSLGHTPVFQVMFALQNTPEGKLDLGEVEVEAMEIPRTTARVDLALSLQEKEGRIVGELEYATSLYEEGTIERYLGYLRAILEGMVADEGEIVERLGVLGERERQLLHEWSATWTEYPQEKCIHELFEEQVRRTPEATAVVYEGTRLSYEELNRRANQLAHYLRSSGVGADTRVAICVERGLEMIIGLLAIVKAGAAYIPLDPRHPKDRLRWILDESKSVVLLTQGNLRERLSQFAQPVIDVSYAAGVLAAQAETNLDNPERKLFSQNLVYIIYTSGSTGKPKGVAIEHRSLVNLVCWNNKVFDLCPGQRSSSVAGFGFDASSWEIWTTLCAGATLVLCPQEDSHNPEALLSWWACQKLDLSFLPTVIAELAFTQNIFNPHLRTLNVGGDRLRHLPSGSPSWSLVNNYGPTETTIAATSGSVLPSAPVISIGKPIANTRIYILDKEWELVPIGVAGEIHIGGAGLARGYVNRADLTGERFVPDGLSGEVGGRLYRTGDLGRWLKDGTIEYLGRNDFQVKVRGFRIELGEIEARVREHAGVQEAVVVAREDSAGDQRLAAYYTAQTGELEAGELRAHVGAVLPEYMVPGAYVWLERLPLTANGKVDRKALPAPDADAHAMHRYEAPRGEAEEKLAGIWGEVLQVERVGRQDNFFELGGHSLLAVRVTSRIRQVLGVEVAMVELFAHPVLGELAGVLEKAAPAKLPPVTRMEQEERIPLSFAQQGLWFLDQLEGGKSAEYNMAEAFRLKGQLDLGALTKAIHTIIERHDILRAHFVEVDGEPKQVIDRESRIEVPVEYLTFLEPQLQQRYVQEAILRDSLEPFDLSRGPLLRIRVLKLGDDEHILLRAVHHIVFDGWSVGVFNREFNALYHTYKNGLRDQLKPLNLQYSDFVLWQRKWLQEGALHEGLRYWKKQLAEIPERLELPTDYLRPPVQTNHGTMLCRVLSAELSIALKSLGQRKDATLFMVLLGGLQLLLARWSGQMDVVVGTPTITRDVAQFESLIGFFMNTLALRTVFTTDMTFEQFLGRVREVCVNAYRHKDVPLERIVDELNPERNLNRRPLFQVMLNVLNFAQHPIEISGTEIKPISQMDDVRSKFDLTLYAQDEARISLFLVYNRNLFANARMVEFLDQFEELLKQFVCSPDRKTGSYSLINQHSIVLLPNATERFNQVCNETVVSMFAQEAKARSPQNAIIAPEGTCTYGRLDEITQDIGHSLASAGLAGEIVAVYARRNSELIHWLLGIMKARAAFTILDAEYPALRLAQYLDEVKPAAFVNCAGGPISTGIKDALLRIGLRKRIQVQGKDLEVTDKVVNCGGDLSFPSPEERAYIAFTSGSTGKPKGVIGTHAPLSHFVRWYQRKFTLGPGDRIAMLSGLSHDPLLRDIFTALSVGGAVCIPEEQARYGQGLTEWLAEQEITILHLTPSLARSLEESKRKLKVTPLRCICFGGEPLTYREVMSLHDLAPDATIVNFYGTTETPQAIGYRVVTDLSSVSGLDTRVPLGTGIDDAQLLVLNEEGQPCGIGELGEIYIRSPYLAQGYYKDPNLTATRFLNNPFTQEANDRMYRTGDLGRYGLDGSVEYSHRRDNQIKIRGFRIELSEIEQALRGHERVKDAVVGVLADRPETRAIPYASTGAEDLSENRKLVAYYTVAGADGKQDNAMPVSLGAEHLRSYLAERLPEYMLPAAYVRLQEIPLTPNGKLDRKQLPVPEMDAYAKQVHSAPLGEIESILVAIWGEILKVERVERRDNFFSLGGHSLLAVRVIARIRQVFQVELSLPAIFRTPTVEGLAAEIVRQQQKGQGLGPIQMIERDGRLPLSFNQEGFLFRIWWEKMRHLQARTYYLGIGLALKGNLDRDSLEQAIEEIIRRHEVLRTSFSGLKMEADAQTLASVLKQFFPGENARGDDAATVADMFTQSIYPSAKAPILFLDLKQIQESRQDAEISRILKEEWQRPFDYETVPLLRVLLFRKDASEHLLVFIMPHLVADRWSLQVLKTELVELYQHFSSKAPHSLPNMSLQYVDFANWQKEQVATQMREELVLYWRQRVQEYPLFNVGTFAFAQPKAMGASEIESESLTMDPKPLQTFARQRGITPYIVMLSALHILIYYETGQEKVSTWGNFANRTRPEIENLIGWFSNAHLLGVDASGDPTVEDVIDRTLHMFIETTANQALPTLLLWTSVLSHLNSPSRRQRSVEEDYVVLDFYSDADEEPATGELIFEPVRLPVAPSGAFGLNIVAQLTRTRMTILASYMRGRFETGVIRAILLRLRNILERMISSPIQRISTLGEAMEENQKTQNTQNTLL